VSVVKLQKEVSQLSKTERLEAMELLWASLTKEHQDMDSPEWHAKVLTARQAKVDS
jgi:putative addiction module component